MKIIDNIPRWLNSVWGKTADLKVGGWSLKLIQLVIVLIIVTILMYLIGWSYQAIFKSVIDLPNLNELLRTLTGGAFIAALGFLCKALIDDDNDGKPDFLKEDRKEDKISDED